VYQLPATQLKTALQALPGLEAEQQSAALSERIDQAVAVVEGSAADPLDAWLKGLIVRLSGPRSAVDRRFVQLSLLIDQGEDTPGIRFVPDGQRGRFDNLATLLANIDSRVIVLLGQPGSGKTTLLQRLQLEEAWREHERPTGRVPFLSR